MEDIKNLAKHLGVKKCNFMDYSMGSSLCFAESTGGDLNALAAYMEGNFCFTADVENSERIVEKIKQIRVP